MKKSESRKGFIKGLSAAIAGSAVFGWFALNNRKEKETVTMLLPNGTPVKVDKATAEKLKKGKAVSNSDLKTWMATADKTVD